MEDVYKICFYGGLALTILLLITSIVLFVVLKIPKVIGELTGHTARKSINEMQSGGNSSSESAKKEQGKYYNQGSGEIKVRKTVSAEKRKENRDDTTDLLDDKKKNLQFETVDAAPLAAATESVAKEDATVLLANMDEEATAVLSTGVDEEATAVLTAGADEEATAVLTAGADEEATAVLAAGADEEATAVLTAGADEEATDVLRGGNMEDADGTTVLSGGPATDKLARKVKVQYNAVVTHTDESL